MKTNKNSSRARTRAHRALSLLTAAVLLMPNIPMPSTVFAASSWSPTLLVNTESFQQIDAGDSTTDVALRFGSSTSSLSLLTTGIFRFTKSVSVQGGLSGSYLTIDHQANISGSLVVKKNAAVKGSLSGATFFGAGLGDCSNTTTSKLIYNPTTGRFSCATDQSGAGGTTTLNDAYGNDADGGNAIVTLTTADDSIVVSNPASGGTDSAFALQIDQDASGVVGLDINTAATTAPALRVDMNATSAAPNLLFGYQGTFDTNLYRKSADLLKTDDSFFAVGTISGSRLRVDGAADIHGALTASGSVRTDGDLTINDDRSSGDAVLTFGNTTANQTLKFLATSQKFEFSKDLRVVGSISGASLRVDGTTTIHGSLSASGAVHFDNNLSINDDQSAADAILTFGNATLNQDLKFLNTEQRFQFSTNLNVVGSISGRTLAVSGASSFSGASLFRTSVTAKGALSGATLFGAGLGDCSNSTTSKLIYNPTTGRFSCATDQTGGSTGGGMSYTDIHNIFVDQAGDTMTGALDIRPSAGSTTVGLNVAATMSGRALNVSGTGASRSPLLFANPLANAIGIGTSTPYTGAAATISGGLLLQRQGDPGVPPNDALSLYTKEVSGRMLLKARGPSGLDYPFQPSFFQNQICMLSAGAGTTINSVGCSATNDTTVSHPAFTETYGFMANFATAATANDTAGSSSNVVSFLRGSTSGGSNGFFYNARIGVVDNTSVRLFSGLSNQTIAVMVQADNPAGHYVGFQYSTGRADTNWQLIRKDGTTQAVTDTGLAVSTSKVYDTYLFCTPQCTTIYWRIDNVTDGTTAEGTVSNNLPGATTAMRAVVGVAATTTTARNIRMQRIYVESDR